MNVRISMKLIPVNCKFFFRAERGIAGYHTFTDTAFS